MAEQNFALEAMALCYGGVEVWGGLEAGGFSDDGLVICSDVAEGEEDGVAAATVGDGECALAVAVVET